MSKVTGNTKIILDGRGPLTLRPSDHIATGGEGSVYKAAATVIKLYTDANKMQRDGMVDKIKILSGFNHDFIVAPKGLVLLPSGVPVGYYMDFVDGEPLPRVFTNDFRKREGFTDAHASILVDHSQKIISFAHSKGAVMVDANEMNWLAVLKKRNDPEPRVIDVDAWSIGKWPASVIMPSIRDWHTKGFNQASDWFSWGIVTFQIYTGIHPYKGTLNGYKPNELEKRMKANASVFSPGVKLNNAVRDFSIIPGPLLDWYAATFQNGKRSIPPSPFDKGIATAQIARVLHATTTASGLLILDKLFGKADDQVIRVFPCGVVMLDSGKLIDLSKARLIGMSGFRDCEIVKTETGWLKAEINNGDIKFFHINERDLKEEELALSIKGYKLFRYENRLFVVTDKGLTEVTLKILGKPIIAFGKTWGVMINSTRWFDGVGIQDTMGAAYLIAPFGESACVQIRVKELDGLKPVTAKAGSRYIVIIGLDSSGNYQKVELTFDREYGSYKAWQSVTDSADLNIAILPKGVCAAIANDGELDIFVPTSGTLNKVQDKVISTDMALANWDDKVVYIQNGAVWSVKMLKK